MESDIDGQSRWSRMVAQWQPVALLTACVAGGLTLTMMVIGSTPNVVVQASDAVLEAAPVETPAVTEAPLDTAASESTEVVDPTSTDAAATVEGAPAAPLATGAVAAPTAAPTAAAPAGASPSPTAAPSGATQTAPTNAPIVTSGTAAPSATAAPSPSPTAAPTTAATIQVAPQAAPTTAAPTTAAPTTAAPVAVALTYPSYTAGSAGTVVLQFDGSSIYVASINRQPNWVAQIDQNGPRTIEIKFFNTATQQSAEWHATVESGRIKVEN